MRRFIFALSLILTFVAPSLASPKVVDIDRVPKDVRAKLIEYCEDKKLDCKSQKVFVLTKAQRDNCKCLLCIPWFGKLEIVHYCLFCKCKDEK